MSTRAHLLQIKHLKLPNGITANNGEKELQIYVLHADDHKEVEVKDSVHTAKTNSLDSISHFVLSMLDSWQRQSIS
jgi:hypothetical protein